MADGLNTKIEVYGLKDAIKQLNSVEPGLRNQIAKDFRNVAAVWYGSQLDYAFGIQDASLGCWTQAKDLRQDQH